MLTVEAATVALALGIAQLSYTFVESPFIRFGQRLENRWRQSSLSLRQDSAKNAGPPLAVPEVEATVAAAAAAETI